MIVWVALALLCLASSTAEGCGKRPFLARVVNGQNASPHAWPWQVSLRVRGGHICGGSLIRDNFVITAAHCVYRNPEPSRYTVVVGAHRRRGTTSVQQTFKLKALHKHSGFTMQNLKDDIALLELDGRVELSDKVNTVCLPSGDVAVGAKCYITGWGRMYGTGPAADILQQGVLPVVSTEDCRRKYGRIDPKAHLCAGEGHSAAAGGCNGDSGGPLVCEENGKFVLHGAVSFGRRNCPTTHFTVFARVNSYLDWIEEKMAGGGGPPPPETPAPPTNGPPSTDGPPPPPTQPPACEDKSGNCRFFGPFCWRGDIKKICPKTCKVC